MKAAIAMKAMLLVAVTALCGPAYSQNTSNGLIKELREIQRKSVDTFSLGMRECAEITAPLRQRAIAMLSEIRAGAMEDRLDLSLAQSDAMSCASCSSSAQKRMQHCESLGATLDKIEERHQARGDDSPG